MIFMIFYEFIKIAQVDHSSRRSLIDINEGKHSVGDDLDTLQGKKWKASPPSKAPLNSVCSEGHFAGDYGG